MYLYLKSGLSVLNTVTPTWPVILNKDKGLTYCDKTAIMLIHRGIGVSGLFSFECSGKPHGSARTSAFTYCGYLSAYEAER